MPDVEIITDIHETEKIWMAYKDESICSSWKYRSCFFDPDVFETHFVIVNGPTSILGVVPLWKEKRTGELDWFGGEFFDGNRFFVHDVSKIPLVLERISGPVHLISIPMDQGASAQLPIDDYRYFIDIEKIGYSFDGFLKRFSSKHRKNLRYDLEKLTTHCEVYHNRVEDFVYMVEQNIKRNENSFFLDEWFRNGFKRMVLAAKESNELEMLSICIDGVLASVQVAILHNREYLVLLGGNDPDIKNVGKLMMMEHIKNAIAKKAKIVDFMSTDTGWKQLWNLDAEPVYAFKK